MTALSYARKHVNFWQQSPIAGKFDDARYPFVQKPLTAISDIGLRSLLIYGPTQSFKSVILEIAIAYFVDVMRDSVLFVAQTDEDAKEFAEIKLNPFLLRIPSIKDTIRNAKYSQTLMKWLWASHEMLITGPGESAQQSKSVRFLVTDESHLWSREHPGAMAALDDRMGLKWNRLALHGTTAADCGTEPDMLYHRGGQNEWNLRCIHCNGLFEPLWEEDSQKKYNGHRVFQWCESENETEKLNSIQAFCPHCDKAIQDAPRNRIEMDAGACYIEGNAGADRAINSFRWNCFAPRWKSWRDLFAIYLAAMESAKLGDFKPFFNWRTKQLVRSNDYSIPMLGTSSKGRDYRIEEVKPDPSKLRVCSFDKQQGQKGEGLHFWGQVDEFDLDGNSRRIAFQKCATKGDCRAFQLRHGVSDKHTACDFGDDQDRYVLGMCAEFHWLALKSTDEESFSHTVYSQNKKQPPITVPLPYSERRPENPMSGKQVGKVFIPKGTALPKGWAISILWSKPAIYPLLYALANGTSRDYKVATNIDPLYTEGLHSYRPGVTTDKTTRVVRKEIWIKCRTFDHSFITSAQNLLLAIIAGYFPMGTLSKTEETQAA
jgi:hypothetical protein